MGLLSNIIRRGFTSDFVDWKTVRKKTCAKIAIASRLCYCHSINRIIATDSGHIFHQRLGKCWNNTNRRFAHNTRKQMDVPCNKNLLQSNAKIKGSSLAISSSYTTLHVIIANEFRPEIDPMFSSPISTEGVGFANRSSIGTTQNLHILHSPSTEGDLEENWPGHGKEPRWRVANYGALDYPSKLLFLLIVLSLQLLDTKSTQSETPQPAISE